MKTSITLDHYDDDAKTLESTSGGVDVGVLYRDALGEFIAAREPVAEYVLKRYAASDDRFKKFKMRDTEKRIAMARLLLRADVTININVEDDR